jgi:hypothetical protein
MRGHVYAGVSARNGGAAMLNARGPVRLVTVPASAKVNGS